VRVHFDVTGVDHQPFIVGFDHELFQQRLPDEAMKEKTTNHYSPEFRERAIRMVREHQGEYTSEWAAIQSIAAKMGCTAETLRRWIRQSQKTSGDTKEPAGSESERIKALEREVRELRQANEILRKASAYFAQAELDRRFKP
jgi:transposase-like protein